MTDCRGELEVTTATQRQTLRLLLAVNAFMFLIEIATWLFAHSIAVMADSLNMLADAMVYSISLTAAGSSNQYRVSAARMIGTCQIVLAILVLVDLTRRFIWGNTLEPVAMIGVGAIALLVNLYCLFQISRHWQGKVHMQANWIVSRNDVIASLGIIPAGILAWWLNSRLPDLVMSLLILGLVLHSAINLTRHANGERSQSEFF